MIAEKLIKFFEGVLSKTKEGKISWEPTAQESNFIAGGQFTLSISAGAEDASVLKPPAFYRGKVRLGLARYAWQDCHRHGSQSAL